MTLIMNGGLGRMCVVIARLINEVASGPTGYVVSSEKHLDGY
jgi:hypothetical protein